MNVLTGLKVAALLAALCIASPNVNAQSKADIRRDQNAFQAKCANCHSIACNRNGPKLEGLLGRRAGSVVDFKNYSSELKDSGIVWSDKTIDEYINDPSKMVPGTYMSSAARIEAASERRSIIAHVKRQDRSIDLCF
jgi:cytochrome c